MLSTVIQLTNLPYHTISCSPVAKKSRVVHIREVSCIFESFFGVVFLCYLCLWFSSSLFNLLMAVHFFWERHLFHIRNVQSIFVFSFTFFLVIVSSKTDEFFTLSICRFMCFYPKLPIHRKLLDKRKCGCFSQLLLRNLANLMTWHEVYCVPFTTKIVKNTLRSFSCPMVRAVERSRSEKNLKRDTCFRNAQSKFDSLWRTWSVFCVVVCCFLFGDIYKSD